VSTTITNYDGGITTTPQQHVHPKSVAELQEILRDRQKYPSPVRAMGSNHSLTPCAASTGTVVSMDGFTKIVKIDTAKKTLTAQAGSSTGRCRRGASQERPAVHVEHRDRQHHAGLGGVLSDEGRPRWRRARTGQLVCDGDQSGSVPRAS
jgi:FAD/FMN-containing dehydrogenase